MQSKSNTQRLKFMRCKIFEGKKRNDDFPRESCMRERQRIQRPKESLSANQSHLKTSWLAGASGPENGLEPASGDAQFLRRNRGHEFSQIVVRNGAERGSVAGTQLMGSFFAKHAEGLSPDRTVHPSVAKAIHEGVGGGNPLEAGRREHFESTLGVSFDDVRVHADSQADSLARSVSARAFTTGTDIYFAASQYRPGTIEGDRLIAHELTHVIQQGNATGDEPLKASEPNEPAEIAADRVADAAVSGENVDASTSTSGGESVLGALQRQPATDQPAAGSPTSATPAQAPAPTPAPAVAGDEWAAKSAEMENVRAHATVRQLAGEAYAGTAAKVIETVKTRLNTASTVYSAAYKDYAKVIAAGAAAAKQEEELIDIGVGVLLAVGIGVGVEAGAALLGIEAAEEATLATKLAYGAGKELLVAGGAEGGKAGLKHGGLLEVVGAQLEPGSLKPEVMKLKLWTELEKLHAEALKVVQLTATQSLIASGAEYAIGEIKAQMAGGTTADMPVDALNDLIGTLAADDAASQKLDAALAAAQAAIDKVHADVLAAPEPSGRQLEMEQDIWILWMAELSPDESDVLDIDAIEDYLHGRVGVLGKGSLLGVDFGMWTSKDDELQAIHAAAAKKKEIEEEYKTLAGNSK
jgi:hypothetical protein